MDALLELLFRLILPAAVGLALTLLVIRGVTRRLVARAVSRPSRPSSRKNPATTHAHAPLFARLRAVGVEVYDQVAPASPAPFRVVLLIGHESVYSCSCCGQRGKYAFGELTGDRERRHANWLGHVCGHCGFVDRYSRETDARGFFSATLEHGSTLLDVVTALESHERAPLAKRVLAVLAEREAVQMAKAGALGVLRNDIAAVTGNAPAHPFRGWQAAGAYKA